MRATTLYYSDLTFCLLKDTVVHMEYEIRQAAEFKKWFSKVKDKSVRIKFLARLARVENGNFGDHKQLSHNLYELRFRTGPGYRIYYTIQENIIVLLLTGGDKSSQKKDIKRASDLLEEI